MKTKNNKRLKELRRSAPELVPPKTMLTGLREFFSRYAHLPEGGDLLLALWTINTWTFDSFPSTPYLSLESAARECGKTTVMQLLYEVCKNPCHVTSISDAALFRMIDRRPPTLLLDEAESLNFKRDGRSMAIRSITLAGYKKGATVPRCIGDGYAVRLFKVYSPKAFAAIGGFEDTLMSRCIILPLTRAPKAMPPMYNIASYSEPLRRQLQTYSATAKTKIKQLLAAQPDEGYWAELFGRDAELWLPLLINARILGVEIEEEALACFKTFSLQKKQSQAEDYSNRLIVEFVEALTQHDLPEFAPSEMVFLLSEQESWGARLEKKNDKAKAMSIASFIKPFNLKSRHSSGSTLYTKAEAMEVIGKYLPKPVNEVDALPPAEGGDEKEAA